jgi:putative membrane protein
MHLAAKVAIAIVGLLHFYFLVLEMFLWTKPAGLKAFGLTPERAESSKVLAANQGLYNGFLGAGLLWSLTQGRHAFHLAMFFLVCVIVAGFYGAATAKNRKILYVQAFPGLIALVLIHLGFH